MFLAKYHQYSNLLANRPGQDHAAALALVSSRPVSSTSIKSSSADSPDSALAENDADLRRPHELGTLHQNIRLAYGTSSNPAPTSNILELQQARSQVNTAVLSLGLRNARDYNDSNTQQYSKTQPEQEQDLDYDEDDAWA